MDAKLTRRTFFQGTALAGAAALGASLLGCQPQATATGTKQGELSSNPFDAPEAIGESEIAETLDADVVVVGLGVAGVAAVRSAAEEGFEVIGIEKCSTPSSRSCSFAYFNTDRARAMHIDDINPAELCNEIMVQSSHYPDMRILMDFATNCGAAVDWYCDAYDPNMVWTDDFTKIPADDTTMYAMSCSYYMKSPEQEQSYQYGRDHEKVFMGTVDLASNTVFDHHDILVANLEAAEADHGARALFDCPACQLVTENGAVVGVIAKRLASGEYVRLNARKAVILATGGYTHNDALMQKYLPWIWSDLDHYTLAYPHRDMEGNYADTGDGHLMATWVGAKMENAPHVPMAHSTLTSTLGVDAFLLLNAEGQRFINEDLSIDHFTINMMLQPKKTVYQFFDANWIEQMGAMQAGLGAYTSIMVPDTVETVNDWTTAHADSLEELVSQLNVSPEVSATMLESIARYNELCDLGEDLDFGKTSSRMFKLTTPPFYVIEFSPQSEQPMIDKLRLLVTMSGLHTTRDYQCIDEDDNPIPGLYAIGNVQGRRFGITYPVTLAGMSHSIALTAGYLMGKKLAK